LGKPHPRKTGSASIIQPHRFLLSGQGVGHEETQGTHREGFASARALHSFVALIRGGGNSSSVPIHCGCKDQPGLLLAQITSNPFPKIFRVAGGCWLRFLAPAFVSLRSPGCTHPSGFPPPKNPLLPLSQRSRRVWADAWRAPCRRGHRSRSVHRVLHFRNMGPVQRRQGGTSTSDARFFASTRARTIPSAVCELPPKPVGFPDAPCPATCCELGSPRSGGHFTR
jgi:hypothetical protein